MTPDLWMVRHPLYCEEAPHHFKFPDWPEFRDDPMGQTADPNLNLLFRWDWRPEDDRLFLYWVLQRKGVVVSAEMHCDRSFKDEVYAYLSERLGTLHAVWAPLV